MSNESGKKPSWLESLNKPAKVEQDEIALELPAYDLPPALKLKRDYDAELGLKQSIGRGVRDPAVNSNTDLSDDSKSVTKTGHEIIHSFIDKDYRGVELIAEPVTTLPFAFNATEFEESIKEQEATINQPEYVEHLKAAQPANYFAEFKHNPQAVGPEPFKGIFDHNEEALIPEQKDPLTEDWLKDISGAWLGKIDVVDSVAYDNHIKTIAELDPVHASMLVRLKAFTSRHVGIIATPEKAEEHIRVCKLLREDPGGWEDAAHDRIKQAQLQLLREVRRKAKSTNRSRYNAFIISARDRWKEAVTERSVMLEILNSKVKALHEGFVEARAMPFEEYVARFELRVDE